MYYSSCIRRLPGGAGIKTAIRPGTLFMEDTRVANVATFLTRWPRHLTTYLCYGRSLKAEMREKSRAALMVAPRRLSTQLAVPGQAAAAAADCRLLRSRNGLDTLPQDSLKPTPSVTPAAPPPFVLALAWSPRLMRRLTSPF